MYLNYWINLYYICIPLSTTPFAEDIYIHIITEFALTCFPAYCYNDVSKCQYNILKTHVDITLQYISLRNMFVSTLGNFYEQYFTICPVYCNTQCKHWLMAVSSLYEFWLDGIKFKISVNASWIIDKRLSNCKDRVHLVIMWIKQCYILK